MSSGRQPSAIAFFFIALVVVAASCQGRPRSLDFDTEEQSSSDQKVPGASGRIIEFDLTRGAPESRESGALFALPAQRTFAGLVRAAERARQDDDAKGFFLRIGSDSLDWARSEELARLFGRLRKVQKKPVVCHAHELDNASTWLVRQACDRVWLSPAGSVETVGIAGQVVYLKPVLDKIGVEAEMIAMGRYKSTGESLTRAGPTDEARESLVGALRSMRQAWLEGAGKGLGGKPSDVLEQGPWTAGRAKELGLVHAIGYESDALTDLKERAKAEKKVAGFGPKRGNGPEVGVSEIIRLIAGIESKTDRPHVAVLPAEGSISMRGGGMLSDIGITASAYVKAIRRLKNDDAVQAVVLRIDSPGGSALASDLIWHELMELRQKKPLVASVGDMAASGGYYLACAANRVVAERTSIVGSIGVVGGKIIVTEALDKIGVNAVTFPASPEPGAKARAAYLSPLEPWDEPTREKVRATMRRIYDLFVDRVAKGRGLPNAKVRAAAQGRIWSGSQGKKLGLVDEIGGLEHALGIARKLGSLEEDAPVRVEGPTETLLEALLVGDGASEGDVEAALIRFEKNRSALLSQLALPLRPFIASLQPLLDGETTLAVLPFALLVD